MNKSKTINLISDTVTQPSTTMRNAMAHAKVGDDVFRTDPTVNQLEKTAADMLGMEDALYCPSGTMTNQIAIKVNTSPLDDLICEVNSHVYQYETGGYSFNSGVSISLIQGNEGRITADQIEASVKPLYDWLPKSRLVVIENSCNRAGGSYYSYDQMLDISKVCRKLGLRLHLDGARLFNVLVETGENASDLGSLFDTVSICLSKGLGAPVGSLLLGSSEAIREARRYRKVMGGGMRQAGIIAAGGLYALNHNIERLKKDNDLAKYLGRNIQPLSYIENMRKVYTNIVIFDLKDTWSADRFIKKLENEAILVAPFGPKTIRMVTHMDVNKDDIDQVIEVLKSIGK